MNRTLAYHVVKGALEMRVQSGRHVFEEPDLDSSPDEVLKQLDAWLQDNKDGRSFESQGYPLSWLPSLLHEANLISDARSLELDRVDLTRFIPPELAYSYEGLTS